MNLDPRIGMLNSGKFYCFPYGYGQPEVIGTLWDVEVALGLRSGSVNSAMLVSSHRLWNVRLMFQYPAWDEIDGIVYRDIQAHGKTEANAIARRRAHDDGHLCRGKGRAKFTAIEQ